MSLKSETRELIVGFVAIALVILAVILGIVRPVSRWFAPEKEPQKALVAVAAYFEPSAEKQSTLRVSGTVLEHGKPLPNGHARVTVRRLNDASQQSVNVVVKDGRFETGDTPAFRDYSKSDRLNIQTDVSKPDTTLLAQEEIYRNTFPPLRPGSVRNVLIGLLILAVAFFWAFTGSATGSKNQAAIIISYCVMVLFLALPFMAFYVLGRYQSVAEVARDVAWSAPVGVLPAVPLRDSDGRPASGLETEWVLNIGGTVLERPRDTQTQDQPVAPETKAESTTNGEAQVPSSARSDSQTGVSAQAVLDDLTKQGTQELATSSDATTDAAPPRLAVEGGLVIPLYVLVLSIIGGAINMTRCLPAYQREAQGLLNPQQWLQTVGEVGQGVIKRFGDGATPTPEHPGDPEDTVATEEARRRSDSGQPAGEIEESLSQGDPVAETTDVRVMTEPTREHESVPPQPHVGVLVRQTSVPTHYSPHSEHTQTAGTTGAVAIELDSGNQVIPSKTTTVTVAPLPIEMTPAERAARWRQGLITQHMYLLSSPFLAIAVFYLLDWLDLRKKPLLVLASFSVGLISDQILSKILSVVEPALNLSLAADAHPEDGKPPKSGASSH